MATKENPITNIERKTQDRIRDVVINRRKFISRGFITGAAILYGTAKTIKSTTSMIIDNREQIPLIPDYAAQIPEKVAEIPEYAEEIPDKLKDTPEYIRQLPKKAAETGEALLEEVENWLYADFECVDWKWGLCFDGYWYDSRDYSKSPYSNGEENETLVKRSPPLFDKREQTKGEIRSIVLGVGIATAGVAVAKRNGIEHTATSRKILDRIGKGVVGGVIWHLTGSIK